jgi:hypothetical protein
VDAAIAPPDNKFAACFLFVFMLYFPHDCTQTVDLPASHRLIIDVPREVPEGRIILTFTPAGGEP